MITIIHKYVPMMKQSHLDLNVKQEKENVMNMITFQIQFRLIYSMKIYAVN